MAFRVFCTDHDGEFPFNVAVTNGGSVLWLKDRPGAESDFVYRHFATVSNELSTTKVLVCPEDNAPRAGTARLGSVWAPNFQALIGNVPTPNSREAARYRNQSISYFLGLTADEQNPHSILSGDRNVSPDVFAAALVPYMNSATWRITWADVKDPDSTKAPAIGFELSTHRWRGNIVLGDGSVQSFDNLRFRHALHDAAVSTGNGPQEFLMPNVVGR